MTDQEAIDILVAIRDNDDLELTTEEQDALDHAIAALEPDEEDQGA